MVTKLSETVEPVPRPFACEGGPADGDYASEGPFGDRQKLRQWPHPSSHFGVRGAAPVLGAVCLFSIEGARATMEPFFA